jgi:hypothetical protein
VVNVVSTSTVITNCNLFERRRRSAGPRTPPRKAIEGHCRRADRVSLGLVEARRCGIPDERVRHRRASPPRHPDASVPRTPSVTRTRPLPRPQVRPARPVRPRGCCVAGGRPVRALVTPHGCPSSVSRDHQRAGTTRCRPNVGITDLSIGCDSVSLIRTIPASSHIRVNTSGSRWGTEMTARSVC